MELTSVKDVDTVATMTSVSIATTHVYMGVMLVTKDTCVKHVGKKTHGLYTFMKQIIIFLGLSFLKKK